MNIREIPSTRQDLIIFHLIKSRAIAKFAIDKYEFIKTIEKIIEYSKSKYEYELEKINLYLIKSKLLKKYALNYYDLSKEANDLMEQYDKLYADLFYFVEG